MRKVLFRMLMIMCLVLPVIGHTAEAKTVGIFLDAPVTWVNNETVRTMVPAKVKEKLTGLGLTLLPFDTTTLAMRTYREDNRMIVNQYYAQPLNRADIQKICKELNAQYAIFIQVSNAPPRFSAGLFSMTFRTTVTCDIRVLDVETGKYTVSKEIVKDGSSTAVVAGVPSFDNAYREALEKGLDEMMFKANMFPNPTETEPAATSNTVPAATAQPANNQ